MLIADDVLLFPVRGLLFVFKEIHKAVQAEFKDEAQAIRNDLSRLYLLLESGQITETQFDQREKVLLDRLDELESYRSDADDSGGDPEDADETEHAHTVGVGG